MTFEFDAPTTATLADIATTAADRAYEDGLWEKSERLYEAAYTLWFGIGHHQQAEHCLASACWVHNKLTRAA